MDAAETTTLVALTEAHFQSFSEAAESILNALQEAVPGTVVLGKCDLDAEHCRVIEVCGPESERLQRGLMLPLIVEEASENGWSPPSGSPQVVAESLLNPEYLRTLSFETWLAIPLELSDGQIVGLLCALADRGDVYRPSHMGLLAVAARLLGHEWERVQTRAELSRLQSQLRDDERSDPDTGLPNRARFVGLLDREWRLAKRGTVHSTVVACHVETKDPHDGAGQAIAKLGLKDAAASLASNARTTDRVGRIGDADLAVVLVGCENTQNAWRFVRRFQSALQRATHTRPFRIEVSFGVQTLADATSAQEALEAAEVASRASIAGARAEEATAEHGAQNEPDPRPR
jgi:diguanylate cyclase (GGDEF)-like protein